MYQHPVAWADPSRCEPAREPRYIKRELAVGPGSRFAFKGRPNQERMIGALSRTLIEQLVEIQSVEGREGDHEARL
jgi:hypothetical protein